MPPAFTRCVATKGSRVRTKKIGRTKYVRICFSGSKSHAGEVKTRKRKR